MLTLNQFKEENIAIEVYSTYDLIKLNAVVTGMPIKEDTLKDFYYYDNGQVKPIEDISQYTITDMSDFDFSKELLELTQDLTPIELFELGLFTTKVNTIEQLEELKALFKTEVNVISDFSEATYLNKPIYIFSGQLHGDYTYKMPSIEIDKILN